MLETLEIVAKAICLVLIVAIWLASPLAVLYGFKAGWRLGNRIADKLEGVK